MDYAKDPILKDCVSFASASKSLRKDSRSIRNRLNSIAHDSTFVSAVANAFDLPLVANERCGRWYIPPENIMDSVYFKSTDGHTHQWDFSTRRLNLHILDTIIQFNGVILVDSTRRGKLMPDSLSKTVPIWCTVINRALFSGKLQDDHDALKFYTSDLAVSKSETAQISERINRWVERLKSCGADLAELRSKLTKPLRAIWITTKSILPQVKPEYEDFYPVVLCTASHMVLDGASRMNGYTYVQGAADDHELWAENITPTLFWNNKSALIGISDDEILDRLKHIVEHQSPSNISDTLDITQIGLTDIYVCNRASLVLAVEKDKTFTHIIDVSTPPAVTDTTPTITKVLNLPLQSGKLGSRKLRIYLPQILSFFEGFASASSEEKSCKIIVACDTGSDFSIGIVLAILCLNYDDAGRRLTARNTHRLDKELIRQRFNFISSFKPKVNPSRATLQSVNAFLMG
ncbi:tRNA A64-2'-O-ribosylphosphate transferase [Dipodascopsis tothii]|uniref:tRNA A64-2'-O-ribosylphosphate transferase n=1 Tax=Dipodascopsis tothii TaxID=44089 RepID=UPI0034CE8CC5